MRNIMLSGSDSGNEKIDKVGMKEEEEEEEGEDLIECYAQLSWYEKIYYNAYFFMLPSNMLRKIVIFFF